MFNRNPLTPKSITDDEARLNKARKDMNRALACNVGVFAAFVVVGIVISKKLKESTPED